MVESLSVAAFGLYLSVTLGAASLAWGFYAAGWASLSAWILAGGALWLLAARENQDGVSSVGLLLSVLAAVFGLFLKLHPGWMFAGGLFALFAWDLENFRASGRLAAKDEEFRRNERLHLRRVTLLLILGLTLASCAMLLTRAEFTLAWGALLVLAFFLWAGLTRG